MKNQKTLADWTSKVTNSLKSVIKSCHEMDELIFTRFIWYVIILSLLFLLSVCIMVAGNIEAGLLPLFAFFGMLYLAITFYRLFRQDELIIVYGVCESKDSYTQGFLDKYHTITDKKLRKYEYRILVMSPDGKESYIYMILNEYNRMREGASYKMLFRKTEDGEFSENNMVTFKQLQQDIQVYSAKTDSDKEDGDEEQTETAVKEG